MNLQTIYIILLLNKYKTTEFLGYETLESDSTILAILKNNDNIEILLDKTPFYGESGGQVGDTGTLTADGINLDVINTYKPIPELIIHKVKINKGNITEEKNSIA